MNNIIKAFNVNNEDELIKFIETLNLSESEENNLFSILSDDMSIDGIRYLTENLVKNVGTDSYRKLKEQFSKTSFKRTLKEDENKNDFDFIMSQVRRFLAYMDSRDIFSKMENEYYDDELDEELDNDFIDLLDFFYKLSDEGIESADDDLNRLKTEYMLLDDSVSKEEIRYAFSEFDTQVALDCAYFLYKSLDKIYSNYINNYYDKKEIVNKPGNDGDKEYMEESNSKINNYFYDKWNEINNDYNDIMVENNDDYALYNDLYESLINFPMQIFFKLKNDNKQNIALESIKILDGNIPVVKEKLRNEAEQMSEYEGPSGFRSYDELLNDGSITEMFSALSIPRMKICINYLFNKIKNFVEKYNNTLFGAKGYLDEPDDIKEPINDGNNEYLDESVEEYMKNTYGFGNEPIFDIGDNVKFEWYGKEITGRVIEVIKIGSVEYYNVISYNTEKQRRETYIRVDPVSNKMEKITEGE